MIHLRTPYLIKRLYYSLIWDRKHQDRVIYLTFDDGPTQFVTDAVLDILSKYQVKATFFCLGRNVERHPDIYHRIIKAGHSVGNHTYSHLKGWKTSTVQYLSDIELAAKYISSNLFRPPYGQIKRKQIKTIRKKYKIIMWDVLSFDYDSRISAERVLKIVNHNIRPGSIVVFHDSKKCYFKLQYVLPRLIENFMEQEYTFANL